MVSQQAEYIEGLLAARDDAHGLAVPFAPTASAEFAAP